MEDQPEMPTPPQPFTGRSRAGRFLVRGLAVVLPTVLTLVILIWLAGLLNRYVIKPSTFAVQYTIAVFMDDSQPKIDDRFVTWERLPALKYVGTDYLVTADLKKRLETRLAGVQDDGREPIGPRTAVPVPWVTNELDEVFVPLRKRVVPYADYAAIAANLDESEYPKTANGVYRELVIERYFYYGVMQLTAVMVAAAIVLLYFLGGLFTARIGGWVVHKFEHNFLGRLPLISNVYSSVKQVTDFFFTERTVEYNRIVAVEYPRRGCWSIGFVTSDSLLEITAAVGEPMVTLLMPTSPMPMTGFTVSVPRSEIIDLNITVDQAFQFCLSCGVLVPPQQEVTPETLREEFSKRLSGKFETDQNGRRSAPSAGPPSEPATGEPSKSEPQPSESSAGDDGAST